MILMHAQYNECIDVYFLKKIRLNYKQQNNNKSVYSGRRTYS